MVSAGADTARTDSAGLAIFSVDTVPMRVTVSKLGFRPDSVYVALRPGTDTTIVFTLQPLGVHLAPVVVSIARTEQRIEDVPIRVEVLAGEDIGEKNAMRPGDLTQMVAEIPGVRVPPLDAGAGGSAMRIQGFRSQYTEFLTDGLPIAGASDAGLSLVEVPPLDLAQVEVIKAGASALYGPSALGGVVNFVTRRPPPPGKRAIRELNLSQSTYRESDAVTFIASSLTKQSGYTLLGAVHHAPVIDPDNDAWGDAPGSTRGSVRPRFFWTGNNGSRVMITAGYSRDSRVSGTIPGATIPGDGIFVDSLRNSGRDVGGVVHLNLAGGPTLDFHLATQLSSLRRVLGGELQRNQSTTSLLDGAATFQRGSTSMLAGAGFRREANRGYDVAGFDYEFYTGSIFGQLTSQVSPTVSLSATGRCDHHSRYGATCTPLIAFLARSPAGFTARLSGALGAYAPTPFVEETSLTGLAGLRSFSGPLKNQLSYERARQASLDAGYHRGALDISASLYAADIIHPVQVRDLASGAFAQELVAGQSPTRLRGVDVFIAYPGDPLAVTAFYGFLHSRESDPDSLANRREVPLSPTHRAGLDVALDVEETGSRVTVEAYYTGSQHIIDDPYRTVSRPYTTLEALATQSIGTVQLFLSAQNLTNVRQTDYDPLLLPARARDGRWTTDAWAPLSGRVLRFGIHVQ
jgi:iron complex outermembrane receptor protein